MQHVIWNIIGILLTAVMVGCAVNAAMTLYASIKRKHKLSIAINTAILVAIIIVIIFIMHPAETISELYNNITK